MLKNVLKMMLEQALTDARAAATRGAVLKRFEQFAEAVMTDQRRRVTPDLRKQVKALAARGKSTSDIVALTGLSAPTVRKVLLQ